MKRDLKEHEHQKMLNAYIGKRKVRKNIARNDKPRKIMEGVWLY